MTPRAFCAPKACETTKAVVHGLLLVTAGLCVAYNATAWVFRRQKHLAANTIVYSALTVFELRKIRNHLR